MSVLEGWKAYESGGQGADPEAGLLLPSAAAISGRIGSLAGDAARKIGAAATEAKATAAAATAAVPSATSFQLALCLFLAGATMQFIAVFIALPVIVLSPTKFAVSFTLGNCFVIAGAGALTGLRASVANAFAAGRAPVAASFLASAGLTLWSALILHSYLLSLLCSCVQVGALSMLVASYVPGGTSGLRMVASGGWSALSSLAGR